MPGIIEWLLERLETVEVVEQEDKLPEGATVVGFMPEELQRLNALRSALCDEHNELVKRGEQELKAIDSRAEQKSVQKRLSYEVHIADERHSAVNSLFWLGLRAAFPELAGKARIGFAEGWQVYWEEETKDAPCQCPRCTARREAEFSAPGIGVEIIKVPMGAGLLDGLGELLSRLSRGPKPGDSNEGQETSQPDSSGEPQTADQPSTETGN